MKRILKRKFKAFMAILVAVAMLLTTVPGLKIDVEAATWNDINASNVYLKQTSSGTCTLFSNIMLARRDQIIKGNANWEEINEEYCRPIMWSSAGMTWKCGIYDTEIRYATSSEKQKINAMSAAQRVDFFKNLLSKHPEGVVIYEIRSNPKYAGQHAVLLTDYQDGMFYVSDPSRSIAAGRIPITKSLVDITEIDSFWIVENPKTLSGTYKIVGSDGNNTTAKNSGYPYPIPTSAVKTGAVGEYAKWVQATLNKTISAGLSVDGKFGDLTTYYVKKFQFMYGLTQDGAVGTGTRDKMLSVFLNGTKPIKSGDLFPPYEGENDQTPTPKINPGDPYEVPGATVKTGVSGDSVKWVQTALNTLISAKLTVNGEFNEKTLYYVKKFQYMYGLTVDGSVGPGTRTKMLAVYQNGDPVVNDPSGYPAYDGEEDDPTNPGAPYTVPTVAVKSGATGDNAKWVQTSLNKLIQAGLTVNGTFDAKTEYYVKKFQYMYGLTEDGSVGPGTRSKMISVYQNGEKPVKDGSTYPAYDDGTVTPEPDPTPTPDANPGAPYTVPTVTVKNGSTGDNAKWVQTSLNNLIGTKLTVDGKFDDEVDYYVQKFQYMYGLDIDGKVGPGTRSKMISVYTNKEKPVKDGSVYPDYDDSPKSEYIKGICQVPYDGKGGGYLIGIESYENPNQSYQYEMLILDCTSMQWVYTTGKCTTASGNALWTVWQPQYGYYWTMFRLYDKNGKLLDELVYGFENIC